MVEQRTEAEIPNQIERVSRLRVSDSVAAQLTQLITKGAYKVGEKLPSERVLSEQFGVSRSSMREAIRGIESSGLVSSSHGVGVFVVKTTLDTPGAPEILIFDDFTVPELFEVRRTLEGEAAALAANRKGTADIDEMERLLRDCADPAVSDAQFVQLDISLHQAVAKASKNGLLAKLYGSLEPLLLEYSRRIIALPGRREHAHTGHVAIVEAIAAGRSRDARTAAVAHIRDVEEDIMKFMKSTGQPS
jgi:GntR family transcriptional repressor for pyruvate dehydrogenase complex